MDLVILAKKPAFPQFLRNYKQKAKQIAFVLHSCIPRSFDKHFFNVLLVNSLYVLNQTTVSYLLTKTTKITKRMNIFFYDDLKFKEQKIIYLTFSYCLKVTPFTMNPKRHIENVSFSISRDL